MTPAVRGALAAAALAVVAGPAVAQSYPLALPVGPVAGCAVGNCAAANSGTYGPALFAPNRCQEGKHFPLAGPNEPACVGRGSYPLSDWHYIRQFCGPTLQPGTCYGHFQTKWRRWDEHCAGSPNPVVGSGSAPPTGFYAPTPTPTEEPKKETLPDPKELPKDEPKKDEPKKEPVAPPKLPLVPKDEPGKVSATTPAVVVPAPLPVVVVPSTDLTPIVVPPLPK